jgi:hypothetical protein
VHLGVPAISSSAAIGSYVARDAAAEDESGRWAVALDPYVLPGLGDDWYAVFLEIIQL